MKQEGVATSGRFDRVRRAVRQIGPLRLIGSFLMLVLALASWPRFDPNAMEAVAMVETPSPDEDDMVSDVFQRGYRFRGTLLRPARVRVKKHEA